MFKRILIMPHTHLALLFLAVIFSGCGGGSGGGGAPFAFSTPTYTVGGTVSGLSGTMVLQNNGGDDLTLTADGPFAFATALEDGNSYDVTILSKPLKQNISITNGSGTIDGADVTKIEVACVDKCWTHPQDLGDHINPDGSEAGDSQVAMDDNGEALIVWSQRDGTGYYQIFLSEYRGGAWTHPQDFGDNISPDGWDAYDPQVAMDDNGEALIVWSQRDDKNVTQIFLSEYHGGAWTHPQDLGDNISPDGSEAGQPQVAMDDNGEALIVWSQDFIDPAIFLSEFR